MSERQLVIESLIDKTARAHCRRYLEEPATMPGPEINRVAQWFCGVGLAGLVLWHEHEEGKKWVKHAADVMRRIIDHANHGDGGGHEGFRLQ